MSSHHRRSPSDRHRLSRDFHTNWWFTHQSRSTTKEENAMQTAHVQALEAKHATLDERIHAESLRPLPDTALLAELKKQKLRLKEEISSSH